MGDISLSGQSILRGFALDGRSDLELVSGLPSIKDAIETLLLTDAANSETGVGGERVFNRGIGLNIIRYLFRSDTPINRAGLKAELMRIPEFEPRIRMNESGVQIAKDPLRPTLWVIKLKYEIIVTGETRNQVVPLFTRDRFVEILPTANAA